MTARESEHIICAINKGNNCERSSCFGNLIAKLRARLLATSTRCASSFYATEQDKCAETRRFAKLWKLSSGITAKRPSLVRKLQNAVRSVNPPDGRENFVKYYLVDIPHRKCRQVASRFCETCPQMCSREIYEECASCPVIQSRNDREIYRNVLDGGAELIYGTNMCRMTEEAALFISPANYDLYQRAGIRADLRATRKRTT